VADIYYDFETMALDRFTVAKVTFQDRSRWLVTARYVCICSMV